MPKPYVRKMPATWWLKKSAYRKFMLRELTAVAVAAYCVFLLVMLYRIKQGGGSYDDFMGHLQTTGSVVLHFFAWLAAMYHTVTWFALLPKVFVVRMGEEKLPGVVLIAAHWLGWLAISGLLIWLVLFR